MDTDKRIKSLDFLRGLAMILIILFHASVYNFANINKIDFSNPPIIVVAMSFMILWGGIMVIYSAVANTLATLRRSPDGIKPMTSWYLVGAAGIYLLFHYLLNIFLGRWNTDLVNNRPDMTAVASSLRSGHFVLPHIAKFFDGSSLSTIAFNLIILSALLFWLFKGDRRKNENQNYWILGVSGFLVMVLSFVRVWIYPVMAAAIVRKDYLVATIYGFVISNPYPLLPYAAYGILGAMFGIMLYNGRKDLMKKIIVPMGLVFLLYGIFGMTRFTKTISKPDFFWYFKTNFELGIFLLLLVFAVLYLEKRSAGLDKLPFIAWFSRISLTIYMLETSVSELMRFLWFAVYPSWDQTINGCLVFGSANVLFWIIVLSLWQRSNFKFSLEYFWVLLFAKFGKRSTKLN